MGGTGALTTPGPTAEDNYASEAIAEAHEPASRFGRQAEDVDGAGDCYARGLAFGAVSGSGDHTTKLGSLGKNGRGVRCSAN